MVKQIRTLHPDYRECILDIDIFGKIVATPQQSLSELTEALFEEFKLSKPMPTLESRRYELSRQVSQDYQVVYDGEPELQDNEHLIELNNAISSLPKLDFPDLTPLTEVQESFTYEEGVTVDIRQQILEKYDLETGEELFKPGIRQIENIVGSTSEDTSLYQTDSQIASIGHEEQEEELAEGFEVSESDEHQSDDSGVFWESGNEQEEDDSGVSFDEENENSDSTGDADDSGIYWGESNGDTTDESVEGSGDDESVIDDDSHEVNEEQQDDDGVYWGDEAQGEEDAQEGAEGESDDGVYYEEGGAEGSDDDGVVWDDSQQGDEVTPEQSEDDDGVYWGEEQQNDETQDEWVEQSEDDGVYWGEESQSDEIGEEQDDSGVDFNSWSSDDGSSEQLDDSGVSFVMEEEPEFIETPKAPPTRIVSHPVQQRPPSTSVSKPSSSIPISKDDVPTDIRAFVRKYPRCEVSFALQFFTKKQIDDAVKLGRIIRKGNILR